MFYISRIASHNGAFRASFEAFLIFGKIGVPAMDSSAFRRSRLRRHLGILRNEVVRKHNAVSIGVHMDMLSQIGR